LKDLIPLTYDYSTAIAAHLILEQLIEIQCMLANFPTDYGISLTDESLLKVAIPPNQFLSQAELRA
jgi:hypothetical protein